MSTPIARYDVVPYQRIENTETFNFGVVAFSRDGITNVSFAIAGQGYSGSSPVVVTQMTHNPRTDVWEYWIPIDGSDFSTDGLFTVTATITESGSSEQRVLSALSLNINATGSKNAFEAWVSNTGNDGTGTVGNQSLPFLTIAAAMTALQTSGGGSCDGSICYLEEGTFSLSGASFSTTNEWATITKAVATTRSNVIVNTGIPQTTMFKIKDVVIQSTAGFQIILTTQSGFTPNIWSDGCEIFGTGAEVVSSNPIDIDHTISDQYYSTDDYIHDCDRGFATNVFVRGVVIRDLGNDAFSNTQVVINADVSGIDVGETGAHGDAYQFHTTGVAPANNRIIYNFRATDLHISGIFARSDAGESQDIAIVNAFIEMRDPFGYNEIMEPQSETLDQYQSWDNFLMWHCSFPYTNCSLSVTLTDFSLIGCVFRQFLNASGDIGDPIVPRFAPGNAFGNVAINNHFMNVYSVTPSQTPTDYDDALGYPLPQWYAQRPDSDAGVSSTVGPDGIIDTNYESSTFGKPVTGSPLINGVDTKIIPADIEGSVRSSTPDIGAFELAAAGPVKYIMFTK